MPTLSINGNTFSFEALKAISVDSTQSQFEKSTLLFCKSWLNGQQEFRINTSGSTGAPKEILLDRDAMEQSARMTINALHLSSSDTALVCLDTKFIAGQMMLVRALTCGMNIVAVEPIANPFADLKQKVDFTALVPYQLENVLDQTPSKLDQVRCALIGGASISHSLTEKGKKSKCALYATYGMTETISHIALQKINGVNPQAYFETLVGVHIRLDDRGCLCINANHLTHEVVTNDLVQLIDERTFKWLGRIDNVINSGGIKIIPEKVESVLEKVFDTLQLKMRFFVAGLPDPKFGQRVVIVCEGAGLSHQAETEILQRVSGQVSKYEVPKEFIFVPKFTETANGKVNRKGTLN